MKIDGWDIPVSPRHLYAVAWSTILCKKPPATRRLPSEWVGEAERLACLHEGLPNPKQIRSMGMSGLNNAMSRHPDLFTHIKRRPRTFRSTQDWVEIAERIASEHGRLPTSEGLRKIGLNGLVEKMRIEPSAFAHVKRQSRGRKTPREYLKIAKFLAVQGVLPHKASLIKGRHAGLVASIARNPEVFKGLKIQIKSRAGETLEIRPI